MKPKVCIVSPYIPPDFAGAGKRAYNQATYLADKGHKIAILTTTQANDPSDNMEIISLKLPKGANARVFRYLYLPILLMKMVYIIKRDDIQLIHCIPGQTWFALLSIVAAKINKIKVIAETTLFGSDDPISIKKSRFGFFKFRIFNLSDAIVNISPLLKDTCEQANIDNNKLHIIGNAVDTSKFIDVGIEEKNNFKKELGLSGFKFVLLYVGVIRPRKGVENLIHMFNNLSRKDDVCLVLAGPLNKDKENILYSNELTEKIKQLGLEENIIFTGEVSNVEEWMKASDVFVFASKREGFGTVLVEAMSTGLPVVTTKIPRISDYIIDNYHDGIIVEDDSAMAKHVENLLYDPDLYIRISDNARDTVLKKYSNHVIMKQYFGLYNHLYEVGEGYE